MNLNIRHATRLEEKDVLNVWGQSLKLFIEEIEQLQRGAFIEDIDESRIAVWMWKNASSRLENFVIKTTEKRKIDWNEVKENARIEAGIAMLTKKVICF